MAAITTKEEYVTRLQDLMGKGYMPNSQHAITTLFEEVKEGGNVLTHEQIVEALAESFNIHISVNSLQSYASKYNLS